MERGSLHQLIQWQILGQSIFSQPNLIKCLLPFFLSPILDVLSRVCSSCQTLQCGPRDSAVSKSALKLSMVRVVCKAFKKSGVHTEVNNQAPGFASRFVWVEHS